MNKFRQLNSTVIPLDLDNVDTDMIFPAEHLKSVSKNGYGTALFSTLKTLYPDFIFNQKDYSAGNILLSKSNFGCGSSREHAVWAITQYGIRAVVCSSFSDIFYNNAAKNGLLLIKLPESIINEWMKLALNNASLVMTIDLVNQQINFDNQVQRFDYDVYRKHCLIEGLDDLDYLLSCKKEIENYELTRSINV